MTKRTRWILAIIFICSLCAGVLLTMSAGAFNIKAPSGKRIALGKKVGVIKVEGVIEDAQWYVDQLRDMRDDNAVAAVVLRVNSPGGGVAAAQEIYEEVKKFRDSGKECVVSMGSVAASGGYYISCPAHLIFANPGTVTGSIGVIFKMPFAGDLMKKIGVGSQTVKSGRLKDMGDMSRYLSAEEKLILQGVVNDTYDQFLSAVAEGRGMKPDSIRPVADGRILTGRQAYELGLVDTLGTFEDAIACAGELGGISGEPEIIEPEDKKFNWREYISKSMADIVLGSKSGSGNGGWLRFEMQ